MPKEREFLYRAVVTAEPRMVFEVGTWKGGGSTYQISEALKKLGKGFLYTCETDKECHKEAQQIYHENDQVVCFLDTSDSMIKQFIFTNNFPDVIFFDGPEDEDTALNDLKSLEPHLKKGSIFMMHDFDPPSIKAKKARPYLEESRTWELLGYITQPDSVGLCKYIKK